MRLHVCSLTLVPLHSSDIPLALRYLQHYHNMRPRRCQTCIPYFLHLCIIIPMPLRSQDMPAHCGLAELFAEVEGVQTRLPVQVHCFRGVEVCQRTYNKARGPDRVFYRSYLPSRPPFVSGRRLVSGVDRRKITGV